MSRIADRALRVVLTAAHSALSGLWFLQRPVTYGAHSIALTPEGRIILVKLRYAPGWRLPGGGRPPHEDPVEAALRELREEIGLVSHSEARLARDFLERVNFKRDNASLVLVRDVRYRPHRWSWEVEQLCEAQLDALPSDLSPITERWIAAVRSLL
ncbi:MAG TPA: NUDIX domain-containing protein [Sphingomicrobium sp.]|nr:NUDIX domain-containing protein [Sphingomicrobium sp.]